MITTITEFTEYPRDKDNAPLPVGNIDGTNTSLTATGSVALAGDTFFIRVATDTAVHIAIGATADADDPYIPAGAVEFFAVKPSTTVYITSA